MATRFATTHHAVNLLRNGNFELAQTIDAKTVPSFWIISGAVPDELGNSDTITSYKVQQGQTIQAGGSDNYLTVIMQGSDIVDIGQRFTRSTDVSFDFQAPLTAGTRRSLAPGYQNTTDILVPRGTYTAAFSINAEQGSVDATLVGYDAAGAEVTLVFQENSGAQTINQTGIFVRTTFSFTTTQTLYGLDLRLSRTAGTGLVKLQIAMAAMTAGTYTRLPFLPDPLVSCFPVGVIVLSMGDGCPPGFEEIGNSTLLPLAEWVATKSDAQGRKGNFPRSDTAQSGTELHTADASFTAFAADTEEFPSYTNMDVVNNKSDIDVDYINPQGDLPGGSDGSPTHEHSLDSAGTRPVSWAFRLCKRL